ncbi:YqaJ viral recombinase family protein [Jeongeupia sp. USM3]|uniref:YqaJ viral recombinase family nuclease n=1 Tax=Jeongeupia sp. USM3 TaxID=1906741 RepID=UPI00089E04CD|nr:YqaJ viral recombinase family protein [Jeongeupia sp. USM3]AOX99671.1 endonuclease [Jeongeupia sp. USM3]
MRNSSGQALRLASTVGLDREQWLQLRLRGIGSSDAAAAVGLSPYKSALSLWLEKTRRKAPDDLSLKEAVIWGQVLEPVLANVYAERTGARVRRVNAVLQHPEHRFMLANLDRAVVAGPDGAGILEIKTAGYQSAPQWEDGIPVAYQCQVLHQLAVTGHAWADVAVLIGGQDFRIYRVERDEERIADLVAREAAFWQCVASDTQPSPDGSADAGSALQWLFPHDDGQVVDLSDSPEFNDMFATLLQLKQRREAIETQVAVLQQRIQHVLGSATGALFSTGRVSWKRSKDRVAADMERLSTEHPELLQQYTKPIAGTRRFLIQPTRP